MATRRERQAEQTRNEILDAGRSLFARQGYRATTVAQIAREAGVAVQTIYDSVGSKAAIVGALNDRVDESARIPELAGQIGTTTEPRALIGIAVAITRSIMETNGDIARTAFRGPSEPELADLRAEGIRRHRAGLQGLVARIAAVGGLTPGVEPEEAADVLALLCDPETWIIWVDDYGWSLARVAAWTQRSAERLLLA